MREVCSRLVLSTMIHFISHKSRFLLGSFPILSDNKAFHVPFIFPILAPFPQITQSTPEKWGLNLGSAIATGYDGTHCNTPQPQSLDIGRGLGRASLAIRGSAIANITTNKNEQPTGPSRLGGFIVIQFSLPE